MAASPPQSDSQLTLLPHPPESDSQISSLLYEISQQVQSEIEDMLNSVREIDEGSGQITEEIEKCKDSALEKKRVLEESKEQVLFCRCSTTDPRINTLLFLEAEKRHVNRSGLLCI